MSVMVMTDLQLAFHIAGVARDDFCIIKMGKSESPKGETSRRVRCE